MRKKASGVKSLTAVLVVILLCVIALGLSLVCIKFEIFSGGKVGVEAVNYLYNFKSVDELSENDEKLKEITTEEAYTALTVTNADKALNTYLKFKNNSVEVEIISSGRGKVVYTLHSDSLSDGRKFIFLYDVNFFGKITNAEEFEAIPFY